MGSSIMALGIHLRKKHHGQTCHFFCRSPNKKNTVVATTCEVEPICFRFDFLGYIQVPGGETPKKNTKVPVSRDERYICTYFVGVLEEHLFWGGIKQYKWLVYSSFEGFNPISRFDYAMFG